MRASRAWALSVLLLVCACGGTPQPTAPEDTTLKQNTRAAGLALSLNRPAEAITQYQRALERARARDDAAAIGDNGYNLAVAQLAANQPQQALASVRMTRAELARRSAVSFPALDLAEATAYYRLGEKTQSDRIAAQVEMSAEPIAAARASFLRGLIADEANNAAGLDKAIARVAEPDSSGQQADADELTARRSLRQGAFGAALTEAKHAADLRRNSLDYRGMARALSVAADADVHAGNTEGAADLYMRAGQSAAAQGDADAARLWLGRAMVVGTDPAQREAARLAIAVLGRPAGDVGGH